MTKRKRQMKFAATANIRQICFKAIEKKPVVVVCCYCLVLAAVKLSCLWASAVKLQRALTAPLQRPAAVIWASVLCGWIKPLPAWVGHAVIVLPSAAWAKIIGRVSVCVTSRFLLCEKAPPSQPACQPASQPATRRPGRTVDFICFHRLGKPTHSLPNMQCLPLSA